MHRLWREIGRRLLVKLGTAGLAALSLPGAAAAMMAQGFTHGVASGEPGANSVLLWTRYAAANDTMLTVELSESDDFARIADRAYVSVQLTRDRVSANWHFLETVLSRTPAIKGTYSMTAVRGRRTYDG